MNNYNPYTLKGKTILVEGGISEIAKTVKDVCIQAEANIVEVPANYTTETLEDFVKRCPIIDGASLTQDATKTIMAQFLTEKDAIEYVTKNVIDKMLLCKFLFKNKKIGRGASIVFSTSIAGIDNVHYGDIINATCSSAVRGMSKSLGLEFSNKGIRVNHVRYGVIATKDLGQFLSPEELAEKGKYFPLKRFGNPTEVANAVMFLLSDASTWITGADLRIDGGYSVL